MRYVLLLPLILLSLSISSFGQKTGSSKPYDDAPNNAMLAKLQAGDTSIDFAAFRIAFTKTKAYSPSGGDRDGRKAAFAALEQKNYKEVVKKAEAMLKDDYVDMDAQVAASMGYRGLGDTAKADFHKSVYDGLINSIFKSGDGKTDKTPYVVISVGEEYVVLRALGLVPNNQSLVNKDGHTFDVLKATDPKSNAVVELYFNIDISWKAETEMFK